MRIDKLRAVALATGLFSGLLAFAFTAPAATVDYKLVPLEQRLPIGKEVTLTVRLLHAPTSTPVHGAVIFRTRLDMSAGGDERHGRAAHARRRRRARDLALRHPADDGGRLGSDGASQGAGGTRDGARQRHHHRCRADGLGLAHA